MQFNDKAVYKKEHFSLGIEEDSRQYYVSIPVSNGVVDYEEYYQIDESAFRLFLAHPEAAHDFLERCRMRKVDDLLIIAPGSNRGVPV